MDCLFCKIIDNELPSYTVYEDDLFKAILDIFPATLGHIIIIPKNHAANIYELDEKSTTSLMKVAKKIAHALKDSFNIDGLNLLQNNGEIASQTVFHFHLHLIPRYKDDGVNVGWDIIKPEENDFLKMLDKIKATF